MLFFLAREHLSKDGHISSSPAAQSTAAAVPQVVQLGSASKSQFFVESLPAERSTNGIRIHGENSHSVLLQVLMFPDPWLFPVVPIEDFISQLCSNIMLKAGRPSLKKIKCPQPILNLLSKEIQAMCASFLYLCRKAVTLFLLWWDRLTGRKQKENRLLLITGPSPSLAHPHQGAVVLLCAQPAPHKACQGFPDSIPGDPPKACLIIALGSTALQGHSLALVCMISSSHSWFYPNSY